MRLICVSYLPLIFCNIFNAHMKFPVPCFLTIYTKPKSPKQVSTSLRAIAAIQPPSSSHLR